MMATLLRSLKAHSVRRYWLLAFGFWLLAFGRLSSRLAKMLTPHILSILMGR
jgi:hypothetical protein